MDLSEKEVEAMGRDEKYDIASNCAIDWAEQYDHVVEEARKQIPGYNQ